MVRVPGAPSRGKVTPNLPVLIPIQGKTPLRNEIEARDAGKLETATAHAASVIGRKHGEGRVAAKIQGHVVVAVA
jgi:hypothetical protein